MKIQLPIDTFIDVTAAEAALDHELCCIGQGGGEVLSVKFPGPAPTGVRQGMPVKVAGLMVTDRFGLKLRAAKVEPGVAVGQKAGGA